MLCVQLSTFSFQKKWSERKNKLQSIKHLIINNINTLLKNIQHSIKELHQYHIFSSTQAINERRNKKLNKKVCIYEDFLHSDSPCRPIDGRMYRYGDNLISTRSNGASDATGRRDYTKD